MRILNKLLAYLNSMRVIYQYLLVSPFEQLCCAYEHTNLIWWHETSCTFRLCSSDYNEIWWSWLCCRCFSTLYVAI